MHTHTHNVTFYIKFGKYSKARVVRILRDFSFFFFCFFSGKRKIHICWLHVHIVLFCVYAKNMKQLFRRKNLSGFCFVKRKATTEILYMKFTFCKWRVFAFFPNSRESMQSGDDGIYVVFVFVTRNNKFWFCVAIRYAHNTYVHVLEIFNAYFR